MLKIKEDLPTHFAEVKKYFSENKNVKKISTVDFKIDKKEVKKILEEYTIGRPNLYALFIKKPDDGIWNIKYIGQRKSEGIKQRLREHFIKCHPKTGSQLKNVKSALSDGYEIGIILVVIVPDEYRLPYEVLLINEFKWQLEWNKQSG